MSVTLRKRKLKSGRTKLFLDIYRDGSRKFESLKLYLNGEKVHNNEVLRMAEIIRARRELELDAELHGLNATLNKKVSFIKYMEILAEKSRTYNTKESWYNVINKLKDFMEGEDLLFGRITKGLMENFKDHLLGIVSQNTAQKYFSMVKTALYHAMRHEMIQQNPAQFITIKKTETLPRFLTLEEVKKLFNTYCENKSVKNAFLFSCLSYLQMLCKYLIAT